MDQPEEGEQPRQEPWGRLLRLGAEEGEPYIPLWKREWTIGRRRGCDLSFPGNKLVSGDHCKIIVDEKSGQVSLQDTSTNGTVINKLKIVKRQTCPLQTGDVIYVVYRKNEPEHNVAYLYESLKEKQGVTPESFEANKENVFLMTEDTSGAGSGGDTRALPPPAATPVCFEEPQPSTSTSNLFHTASTSSLEPASVRQEHPSASGPGGVGLPSQGCGPAVADGEASPGPPLLVADPCQDPPAGREDSRAEAVKPDRMEETLTCIICQELLHDCVRYNGRGREAPHVTGMHLLG